MHGVKALFGTALLSSLALASNVLDLTPKTFDKNTFDGTPSLVEFFAPWCGHCKKLAPVYEELADSFQGKKVHISKVDADEHKELGTKFGISGFPTIKFFDGKSKEPQDYSGGRDLESLQKFIEEKTKLRPTKAAKAPSQVVWLNDKNYNDEIGKDKDVLIACTTSWCGHCKNLAPTWEKLATDFEAEPGVSIAKVDCEASPKFCEKHGVKSYPTIKFFPKGSSDPEAYSGARDEVNFVDYVNEKVGTHRIVGGGLDAKAGTVEVLDKVLTEITGNNVKDIADKLKKASADLKDKYSEYYVKAANKLSEKKDYVDVETKRLEGLLQKGGLSRAKQDDLTSRLNILKKFNPAEPDAGEPTKEEL